jgi:hypothetical protein
LARRREDETRIAIEQGDSGRPADVTARKIWFFLPPLLIFVQALQLGNS